MNNIDNKPDAYAAFIDIIRNKKTIEPLADSQVLSGINTFQNLAIEHALHKLERAQQEGYLSTAYKRSSLLALAEDRQYLPRKAAPSYGQIRIRNKSDRARSVMSDLPLASDDQVFYIIDESVRVDVGEEVVISGKQLKKEEKTFFIDDELPFIEFELGRQSSVNLHSFNVFVDSGSGFQPWYRTNRFRNASESQNVFDEFYSHTDQVGIRFGNNVFGKIPPSGSEVRVEMWLTQGDVKLMPNQPLTPAEDGYEGIEFETASVFTSGQPREDTNELRRNALYYSLYDDNHVWNDDYLFFIRRHFPAVIWGNVWGEEEQEKMDGEMRLENVNKIFICLYAPDNPNIGEQVEAYMRENIPQFNRRYQHVPVEEHAFVAEISGKLKRSVSLGDATKLIREKLIESYGKNTRYRKRKALKRDLYRLMNGLKVFESEDDIYINLKGMNEPETLKQMVYIDIDETLMRLDLDYTDNARLSIF